RLHTRSKRDWSSDVCSSDLWKSAAGHVLRMCACCPLHPYGAYLWFHDSIHGQEELHLVPQTVCAGDGCGIQYIFFQCGAADFHRSEERRVGKEWSDWWCEGH